MQQKEQKYISSSKETNKKELNNISKEYIQLHTERETHKYVQYVQY